MSASEIDFELRSYLASFLSGHKLELLPRLLVNRTRHLTVVVEDIYQPHNASACLRSCDCFGVQDVHIIENYNEFSASSGVALGASQWLTLNQYDGEHATADCLNVMRDAGYSIVVTSPHDADCDLETYDVTQPTALLFGAEKDGASQTALQMADHVMRIPMYGFTESFNISVAVAVCLHHLVCRLRDTDVDWRLSRDECESILMDWVHCASGKRLEALKARFAEQRTELSQNLAAWPDWSQVNPNAPRERGNREDVRK